MTNVAWPRSGMVILSEAGQNQFPPLAGLKFPMWPKSLIFNLHHIGVERARTSGLPKLSCEEVGVGYD
jgi:hypothetical protein